MVYSFRFIETANEIVEIRAFISAIIK